MLLQECNRVLLRVTVNRVYQHAKKRCLSTPQSLENKWGEGDWEKRKKEKRGLDGMGARTVSEREGKERRKKKKGKEEGGFGLKGEKPSMDLC